MKSLKILLTSLFLSVITIGLLAFISKDYQDAFSVRCFRYMISTYRNLDPYETDAINPADFKNASNWTLANNNPHLICYPGYIYVCRLCFDDSQLSATVTLSGILNALYDYINLYGLPPSGSVFYLSVNGVQVLVALYLHTEVTDPET